MGSSLTLTQVAASAGGLLAALLVAPALSHGVHAPPKGAPAPVLVLEGEFVVTELYGRAVPSDQGLPVASLNFLPRDGVNGSTGCNRFQGKLLRSGASVTRFRGLGLTKMACQGPAANLERNMLAALRATHEINKFGAEVRLKSFDGRLIARLKSIGARADAGPSLYGKSWALVSMNGQILNPQGPRPSVNFDANRITGSTGCNQFSGLHQRLQGKSRFANIMQTQRACLAAVGDPMATEAIFMATLAEVDQVSLAGNQLILRSSQGPSVLIFEASN